MGPSEQAILADTFPPEKRGLAFCVRHGRSCGSGNRPHSRRMDHRQLRLALDLLHQRSVGIVSLLLTWKVVEDPPFPAWAPRQIKVDYIGLSLIAVGIGFLQVVLDKGQQDDWFGRDSSRPSCPGTGRVGGVRCI